MAFDILELPSIPRERDKLKAIIGAARYQRRRRRIMRYASYAILVLALLILSLNGCSRPRPASNAHTSAVFYLPAIHTQR